MVHDLSPEDNDHRTFLEARGWYVASLEDDDDQDRDYEVDGEDYEDDEEGTEAPLEWGGDEELLSFEELAEDDIEEGEKEEEEKEKVPVSRSSLQEWADDSLGWRDG